MLPLRFRLQLQLTYTSATTSTSTFTGDSDGNFKSEIVQAAGSNDTAIYNFNPVQYDSRLHAIRAKS